MKKLSLIFALALALVGVSQAKAETVTEDFETVTVDGTTLSNGWFVQGGTLRASKLTISSSSSYDNAGNYSYELMSKGAGSSSCALMNYTSSNAAYLIIPQTVAGTLTFKAGGTRTSGTPKVTICKVTEDGGVYTVGETIKTITLSTRDRYNAAPTYSQQTVSVGDEGTMIAINLVASAIDDISYTEYEAPTGAELNVLVDGSKVDYNYNFDFGVTTAGATKTFTMKNPGGEDLDVTVAADGGFTVNPTTATIASKSEVEVTVTMPEASAEGSITITPSEASGLESFILHASGQIVPVMEVYLDETAIVSGFADKFGKVSENAAHTYTVKNTGTAALNVAIASDNAEFTVSPANLEVAVGEEATFEVTFNYNAENVGARNANITLTPADNYNTALTFTATANVADPNVWSEDFESEETPEGWDVAANWSIADGVAHGKYSRNSTTYLTTPALEVKDGDSMDFMYKATANYVSIKIQMSKDGADFADFKTISGLDKMDDFETYTIDGLEAGIYQFRFANDDYDLDNFEGFKLATLAHDVAITSFDIPSKGYTGDEYVATVTLQEKAGVDEPMWAKLYINGNVVAQTNKEVKANTEETLTLTFVPTAAVAFGGKAYIEVYNTNKDFTKKTEETSVSIEEVTVLEISESTTNTFTAGSWDRVKMDYTVREGWNTIALPFMVNDLTVFGENVKAWGFTGYDGNLKFSKVTGSLAAATPYILYVENPTEGKVVFQNVTISSFTADEADCYKKQGDATFQGTYSRMVAGEMEGKYGVTTDGEIRVGSANATMKAFRAYFILPEAQAGDGSKVNLIFDEDGMATQIEAAEILNEQNADIFDLSGRKVNHAQKGIYIQNGKKFVVK